MNPTPVVRSRWWVDWLATLPVLLLIPAILVPYLVLGGSVPSLAVSGAAVVGEPIGVTGSQFDKNTRLRLMWDGETASWLPVVKTSRKGTFSATVTIPGNVEPGEHEFSVTRWDPPGRTAAAASVSVLASVAVLVSPGSAAQGDSATPTPTSSSPDAGEASAAASESPGPTATTAPTQGQTATAAPTATTAPTATAVPTPAATSAPPPPPSDTMVGYGAGVTGGSRIVHVYSLSGLRNAIVPGNHVVLGGSGTWDLGGHDLVIDVRDFTLDNRQAGIVFKGGALRINPPAGNVLLRHVKSRAGDASGNAQDLDAITVNAEGGKIRGLYFDHVEAWWGPDVTFALLGDVADVTLDGVIIAGGLVKSAHPEASEDIYGHSMGLNMTALSGQAVGPQRVTIYRSLLALNQTRNPQLRKAGPVDIIDSVIFGHDRAPYGDALGGLNIVGTVYRRGGAPAAAFGSKAIADTTAFRAVNKDGYLTPRSVYVDPTTRAVDYTLGPVDSSVRASLPKVPISVRSAGGDTEAIVLGYVGARSPSVDAVTQSLLSSVRNSGGRYYNGAGYAAPNPIWP